MKKLYIKAPYRPRVNPYRKRIVSTAIFTLLAVILTVYMWPDVWTRLCGLMLIPSAGLLGWVRPWNYGEEPK